MSMKSMTPEVPTAAPAALVVVWAEICTVWFVEGIRFAARAAALLLVAVKLMLAAPVPVKGSISGAPASTVTVAGNPVRCNPLAAIVTLTGAETAPVRSYVLVSFGTFFTVPEISSFAVKTCVPAVSVALGIRGHQQGRAAGDSAANQVSRPHTASPSSRGSRR